MGSLAYLVSIMVMCLAVIFVCGVLFSYLLRRSSFRRMAAESEKSWLSRLRQTEQDRDTRIAKLRSEVDEHRHQVPTMEKSLAERSDIINSLEGTIDEQKNSIEKLKEKLSTLSSSSPDRVELEKVSALESSIESHQKMETTLNRELDELRQKHNDTNARAIKAEEELEALTEHQQQRLVAMEDRVTDAGKISEELDASREKVGKLQNELSSVTGRLTKLEQEHGSCSAQLEGVSGKLKDVRAEAQDSKQQTERLEQQLAASRKEVDSAKAVNDELKNVRAEAKASKTQVEQLGQQLAASRKEVDLASAANDELKNIRTEAQNSKKLVEQLEQQLSASQKSVDAAKATSDELTQQLASSQQANEQVHEQNQAINRLRSKVEEGTSQLSNVELRKTELEQTLRTSVEEVASGQREISELRNATAELEARNAQLDDQFQRAKSELNTSQSHAEEARKEFAQWRNQAEQLENLLQAHQATADEAKGNAQHWQSEHDKLKAQWANESAQLDESRRQVKVLTHELNDAKQSVEASQKKHGEWQQRLDNNERTAAAEARDLKAKVAELSESLSGSSDQSEEVAMLKRTLELRDSEFTSEHQQHNEQRQLADDWRSRYEQLKEEHDALAASRKASATKRKPRKAPVLASGDKPDWLLSEAPQEKDDLKKIWGVGPVMEKTMNSLGIYLFRQVAALKKKDIEWVTTHINTFPDRIVRDDWVGQAAKLRKEKYGR